MEAFFLGQISLWASFFAPSSWAFCDGSLQSIAENTALFSVLGTYYGGNGQTNFALPDFRSRVPLGAGQGPGLPAYSLAQSGGTQSVTLTSANLPQHNHGVASLIMPVAGQPASSPNPANKFPAIAPGADYASAGLANGTMKPITGNTGTTGAGQPLPIGMPVLSVNFIIALYGIFPSRS